ncbi:M28 family metallopeptidase [Gordonia sp. NPDC003585]|uniref:M28 family metallopeptidase n=1 Tax=Gordonia sp. NPDC003585 TaxID=3154275 RepID=UPI0033A6ADA4
MILRKRTLIATTLALLLVVSGCASAGDQAAQKSAENTSISSPPSIAPPITDLSPESLARGVTVDNVMRHLKALQQVADDHHGNRAAGTPGYDASVDYVADMLRRAGFTVSTPTFEYTRFESGPVDLKADGIAIDATVLQYTTGTGDHPVTGNPVTVGGFGCVASDYPAATRGAIAVVTRGTCQFVDKARLAEAAGARGVIVVNNVPGKLAGATLGDEEPPVPTIPVVGVAAGAGDQVRAARSISLSVTAGNKKIVSRNVIAQTTTGSADDVVLAGAHLDSVPAGPGINDNGTGTAALLETALRLGSAPRVARAVRFAFWGAEEEGLIGSTRYVESLDVPQRQALALYLNFDMLGSPNFGYFVYDGDDSARDGAGPGPDGSAGIERVLNRFYATFPAQPITTQPGDFDGRSDYGPFIAIGVPAGGVDTGAEQKKTPEQVRLWGGTAGQPFDPNYHSPRDTIDNVNNGALAVNASAVAYGVATYALAVAGPDAVPGPRVRQRTQP